MTLKGKRVLVTGGARRIGAAIARNLAKEGCHLILHYHQSAREIQRLARELRTGGLSVNTVQADLTQSEEVLLLASTVLKKGPIDILINNASIYYPTPFKSLNEDTWDRFMQIHLKAPFFLSKALAGGMQRRGGRIINIADQAGEQPYRDYLPYCVSKGALLNLTRALARELAPKVHVNSISPGPILPPPWRSKKQMEGIRKRTPLQRWGGPEEIANAVVFLCVSDFITGTNLVIDGGFQLV